MIRHLAAALMVASLYASPLAQGSTAFAQGQGPEFETTQIADGVYRFRFRAHNAVFIVTGEGVVAFDPISTEAAQAYRSEIAKVTSEPVVAIVYSHHHADHISGAAALANDVPIIAHAKAYQALAAEPNPEIVMPNHTFSDEMTMRIGSKTIHLVYTGPNHSDNTIVGHLPDQGIIFAVDFVSRERVGFRNLPDYYFPDLFESLERLQQLEYQTAVFGHGEPGTKADVYGQINYWADVRAAVEAAIAAGQSEDEAVESIDLPAYSSWGGYEQWFKMNVRTVYQYYAAGK